MAKTISERAKEYANKYSFLHTSQRADMESGYIKGAEEQLKADKEKVYHALEKMASKEVLEELMKIMEE